MTNGMSETLLPSSSSGNQKTRQRHRFQHHLSSTVSGNGCENGWVEGITNLTEGQAATELVAGDTYSTRDCRDGEKDRYGQQNAVRNGILREETAGMTEEINSSDSIEEIVASIQKGVEHFGEVITEIGSQDGIGPQGLNDKQLNNLLEQIRCSLDANNADLSIVRQRHMPALKSGDPDMAVADICARRRPGGHPPIEVRVAIVGNVDSGKSTSVGVLTRSVLDDGRGSARARVFKHGHEESTGRTSSIGQHNLCLDSNGKVLNDPQFRTSTMPEYISKAAKVVTMVDLAGHEKYFKTTA